MPSLHLFDTNTFSAIMAEHPQVKAKLARHPGRVVSCAIVQGEIRYGLERLPAGKRRTNLENKAAIVLASMPIEPVTVVTADIYAAIRRDLERQGYNLSDNDLWIAATALSLGAI